MIFLIFLSTLASLILAGTNKYKASIIFFSISMILLLAVFIPHTIRYINIQL